MSGKQDRRRDEKTPSESMRSACRLSMVVESAEEEASSSDDHEVAHLLRGATGCDSKKKRKQNLGARIMESMRRGLGSLGRMLHLKKSSKKEQKKVEEELEMVEFDDIGSATSADLFESRPEGEKFDEMNSDDSFQEEFLKKVWKGKKNQMCDSMLAITPDSLTQEEEEEEEEEKSQDKHLKEDIVENQIDHHHS